MFKLLYLMPLIMAGLWMWYLKANGWTIRQGKKGFLYILIFNLSIAGMLTIIIQLTQH